MKCHLRLLCVSYISLPPHGFFLRDNRYVHERSCARFNEHPVVVLLAGAPAHRTKRKKKKVIRKERWENVAFVAHTLNIPAVFFFLLSPSTELYIPEYDCHNRSYEPVVAVIITCAALLIWLRLPPPPKDADCNGKFLFLLFRLLLYFLYCLTTSPVQESQRTLQNANDAMGTLADGVNIFPPFFTNQQDVRYSTLKPLDLHEFDTKNFHRSHWL